MKLNRTIPAIAAAVLILTVSGFAQQALKVAVVNSQLAFSNSLEGKKAGVQFQERDQRVKADLQRMDDAIRTLETKLNTQRLTLTQEALIQLQSDIERKTTERKRSEEDATRDLQQLQFNLVQKIRTEMISIIEALAKERGYDLVLDLGTSGTVYFNPTIDITDEVIKRYDAAKATAAPAPPVKK